MGRFLKMLKQEANAILDLISPRLCNVCGCVLSEHEKYICVKCYMDLPRTGYHKAKHSFLEANYWGKIPIERAAAYFFYTETNRPVLFDFKYHTMPGLGEHMAMLMAQEICDESDFFKGIDVIVPVPLHHKRKMMRGYNQCDYIARGIQHITDIPICAEAVIRIVDNESQTNLTHQQREENVANVFRCVHPELLRGKHILLVDDVVTTGATTRSCAKAILQSLGEYNEEGLNLTASVKFSILALATATPNKIPMDENTPIP